MRVCSAVFGLELSASVFGQSPSILEVNPLFPHQGDTVLVTYNSSLGNAALIGTSTAEAIGSEYHSKQIGSFGKLGVFSFNGTKIVTSGGGGAIVTNDVELGIKAKHLTTTAKVPLDTKTQLLNIEEIKLKFNKLNSILNGKSFSINSTVKFHSKNVVILKNKH